MVGWKNGLGIRELKEGKEDEGGYGYGLIFDTMRNEEVLSDADTRRFCLSASAVPVIILVWRGNGPKKGRHSRLEEGCPQYRTEVSGENETEHSTFL